MHRAIYPRPVIPLLIALIAGIAGGTWFPGYALPVICAASIPLGCLLFALKKQRPSGICPLFLVLFLGYLSIQPWAAPQFPSNHVVHFTGTRLWEIHGIVDTSPVENLGRLRFAFRTDSLIDARTRVPYPVVGKVRVTISALSSGSNGSGAKMHVAVGDRLSIIGKIKRPRNFHNPGGFDYERFMAFQEIWATTFVPARRVHILSTAEATRITHAIEAARLTIAKLINASTPTDNRQEEKAVLRALIVGDRGGISNDLRDAFNRAGTGHLLAISGLHVGIVATVAFFLFQGMLSFSHALLWKAWTRKGAAILAFFPVLFYGLIAGMSPSTQRAVIMVTVFLMTFLFEREQDGMNTLALAATVILIVHPPALFSVSFLLSFGAVFAIIFGLSRIPYGWTARGKTQEKIRLLRAWARLRLFLLVSLSAILGTLPLVMYFFNQISLIGLLSNCLLVPLIGFLVVPLGLFSVLLLPLWHDGAAFFIQIDLMLLQAGIALTKWLAHFPFSAIKTITPNLLEICCYYILALALLNLKSPVSGSPATGDIPDRRLVPTSSSAERRSIGYLLRLLRQRILALSSGSHSARTLVLMVLIIFAIDGCYWVNQRFLSRKLKMTTFDVGQGSATLIELPGGNCFLLDGGGFSDNSVFDVGERIIAPLLWRKKIMTVGTLILSHPNSDHLNGLLYIADHFNVKMIWTNDDTARTLGYSRLMSIIEDRHILRPRFKELARSQEIDGVAFHILYPPQGHPDPTQRESWRNSNNNSMVIKLVLGKFSFLFPGDIQAPAERELVSLHGDDLKSTVLLAPHHGSRTSSGAAFLSKVNPEQVLISAGWRNHFGFPNTSVLKRYRDIGCKIYTTGDHGAIVMATDGESLMVETAIEGL